MTERWTKQTQKPIGPQDVHQTMKQGKEPSTAAGTWQRKPVPTQLPKAPK